MSFVIPVALQIHFFSKNKNDAGYMQEPNRTLLKKIITTAIKFHKKRRCQAASPFLLSCRSKRNYPAAETERYFENCYRI